MSSNVFLCISSLQASRNTLEIIHQRVEDVFMLMAENMVNGCHFAQMGLFVEFARKFRDSVWQ